MAPLFRPDFDVPLVVDPPIPVAIDDLQRCRDGRTFAARLRNADLVQRNHPDRQRRLFCFDRWVDRLPASELRRFRLGLLFEPRISPMANRRYDAVEPLRRTKYDLEKIAESTHLSPPRVDLISLVAQDRRSQHVLEQEAIKTLTLPLRRRDADWSRMARRVSAIQGSHPYATRIPGLRLLRPGLWNPPPSGS